MQEVTNIKLPVNKTMDTWYLNQKEKEKLCKSGNTFLNKMTSEEKLQLITNNWCFKRCSYVNLIHAL